MPRRRSLSERQYHPSRDYDEGYEDGYEDARREIDTAFLEEEFLRREQERTGYKTRVPTGFKPKRKLSAWNKYVKANSKKPRFRYRNGKLNLKKMAVAFRKTPAGRKKKRR